MILAGVYELTIDPKNRLSIPASIRAAMDPVRDGTKFYLVPGSRRGTLGLYPDRYYETYAERYHASLKPGQQKRDFEDLFYSMAALLELDKQGRVVLPQRLLQFAGISSPVTLTGARDHLVLWNRRDHQAFVDRLGDQYPELLEQAQQHGAGG